jgi:hypothetical protein
MDEGPAKRRAERQKEEHAEQRTLGAERCARRGASGEKAPRQTTGKVVSRLAPRADSPSSLRISGSSADALEKPGAG